MSNEDGSYAPKSPDLSSFYSGGGGAVEASTLSHNSGYNPPSYHHQQSLTVPPPASHSHFAQPQQPHPSYNSHSSHYQQPEPYTSSYSHYNDSPYGQATQQSYQTDVLRGAPAPGPAPPAQYYSPSVYAEAGAQNQYQPPLPHLHRQEQQLPAQGQHIQPPLAAHGQPPPQFDSMPPRKAAAQQAPPPPPPEPEILFSPVRTKFPTARIKRIMQADEEVGKVAQQTPIAVGKALELFMVQIVNKSADVAKDKNSKRITAQMLKQAVDTNPQWDFLQEIVSKVSEKEEASKSGKAKAESESDEDFEAAAVEQPKKKGKGGRRKKGAA